MFGQRFIGASLCAIRLPTKVSEVIVEFMDNPKNFLVFLGNPGLGKTYLCSALIPWALKTFDTIRYWHENDLLQKVRDSISEGHGDYLRTLSLLIDDELLMFDDVGCNKPNEWREEVLFDLIDTRYNMTLPTIITSNLTRKEMHSRYHARFASRLFASENKVIEMFEGEDLRQLGM